jgi:murein DD-endopeptidase MepM/ murein hydrolase activator NlpD
MTEACALCGTPVSGGARLVLVRGRRQEAHCSEECLSVSIRRHRLARRAAQRRWGLRGGVVLLLAIGIPWTWHRFRAPQPQSLSLGWSGEGPQKDQDPPPAPPPYGPPWPPTDEDWKKILATGRWTYPLPGPHRRAPRIDARIFGPEPRDRRPTCREAGRCGVDLGGELWGEHVLAALDGEVDHVQPTGNAAHGGVYVRLAHFGGFVFTHYHHLAATRRRLRRGTRVTSGEVIGLLGDTGLRDERRHLHFALSTRPSRDYAEVYWDPTPLMGAWPLRVPTNGTVAGFNPPELAEPLPRRRPAR